MATTKRNPPTDATATPDPTTTVEDRIEQLRKRKKAALTPGGRDAAKKQHDRGKLTPASGSRSSWTMVRRGNRPVRSTGRTSSAWTASARPETASSPATHRGRRKVFVASQDSRSSGDPWARSWRRRSAR